MFQTILGSRPPMSSRISTSMMYNQSVSLMMAKQAKLSHLAADRHWQQDRLRKGRSGRDPAQRSDWTATWPHWNG